MNSSWLWRITGFVALIACFTFLTGFGLAVKSILFPHPGAVAVQRPEDGNPLLAKSKIQIVALGDSITHGTGDETAGGGYVGEVKDELASWSHKPVYIMQNFAVNGYNSSQLLHDLNMRKDERNTIAQANVVLLTIGANDLFHLGKDVFNPSLVQSRIPAAAGRVAQIFKVLAEANPKAQIIYVGLYNPFVNLDKNHQGSLVVEDWNNRIFNAAAAYSNITVVPTFDLFVHHEQRFMYSDHFHPNHKGYVRIAKRIVQALQ